MITTLRPTCNDRNFVTLQCETGDLNTLNSDYTNVPHGSIANIIGSNSYYQFDDTKQNNKWIMVR